MDIPSLLAQVGKFFDITLGNLITIATFAGAFLMGWQRIRDQLCGLENRMASVESNLKTLADHGVPTVCSLHTKRLDNIEQKLEIVATIAADVTWIKSNLERIGHQCETERRHRV